MTSIIKGEKQFNDVKEDKPYTCHSHRTPKPDSEFAFAPVWTGSLNSKTSKISFEGNCFEKIDMVMTYDKLQPDTLIIQATAANQREHGCTDYIFIANTDLYHYETISFQGDFHWTFKVSSKEAQTILQENGI